MVANGGQWRGMVAAPGRSLPLTAVPLEQVDGGEGRGRRCGEARVAARSRESRSVPALFRRFAGRPRGRLARLLDDVRPRAYEVAPGRDAEPVASPSIASVACPSVNLRSLTNATKSHASSALGSGLWSTFPSARSSMRA